MVPSQEKACVDIEEMVPELKNLTYEDKIKKKINQALLKKRKERGDLITRY